MKSIDKYIKNKIITHGSIAIDQYMTLLQQISFSKNNKAHNSIGKKGNFITSPEVSQIFGEMIGVWSVNCWQLLGSPKKFKLVELGPGNGTLTKDMLKVFKNFPSFMKALDLNLVEMNKNLEKLQRQNLKSKAKWHKNIKNIKSGPIIFIANEFFDSLPIKQYQYVYKNWYERIIYITKENTFGIKLSSRPQKMNLIKNLNLKNIENGAILECPQYTLKYIDQVCKLIKKYKGAALIIDYGYNQTTIGNSLQAIRTHKKTSIFDRLGYTDLSSHVNFELLIGVAKKNNLSTHGPISQSDLLNKLGIEYRVEQLSKGKSSLVKKNLQSQLKRLTGKKKMGELFKAIYISSINNEKKELNLL